MNHIIYISIRIATIFLLIILFLMDSFKNQAWANEGKWDHHSVEELIEKVLEIPFMEYIQVHPDIIQIQNREIDKIIRRQRNEDVELVIYAYLSKSMHSWLSSQNKSTASETAKKEARAIMQSAIDLDKLEATIRKYLITWLAMYEYKQMLKQSSPKHDNDLFRDSELFRLFSLITREQIKLLMKYQNNDHPRHQALSTSSMAKEHIARVFYAKSKELILYDQQSPSLISLHLLFALNSLPGFISDSMHPIKIQSAFSIYSQITDSMGVDKIPILDPVSFSEQDHLRFGITTEDIKKTLIEKPHFNSNHITLINAATQTSCLQAFLNHLDTHKRGKADLEQTTDWQKQANSSSVNTKNINYLSRILLTGTQRLILQRKIYYPTLMYCSNEYKLNPDPVIEKIANPLLNEMALSHANIALCMVDDEGNVLGIEGESLLCNGLALTALISCICAATVSITEHLFYYKEQLRYAEDNKAWREGQFDFMQTQLELYKDMDNKEKSPSKTKKSQKNAKNVDPTQLKKYQLSLSNKYFLPPMRKNHQENNIDSSSSSQKEDSQEHEVSQKGIAELSDEDNTWTKVTYHRHQQDSLYHFSKRHPFDYSEESVDKELLSKTIPWKKIFSQTEHWTPERFLRKGWHPSIKSVLLDIYDTRYVIRDYDKELQLYRDLFNRLAEEDIPNIDRLWEEYVWTLIYSIYSCLDGSEGNPDITARNLINGKIREAEKFTLATWALKLSLLTISINPDPKQLREQADKIIASKYKNREDKEEAARRFRYMFSTTGHLNAIKALVAPEKQAEKFSKLAGKWYKHKSIDPNYRKITLN